jgi:hypothetical protein
VLAVLGAVLIVAVAVVARSAIDDDGSDDPGGDDDGGLVIMCDADFSDVCEALGPGDVRREAAVATATGLDDGSRDDVDVWITSSAWAEVLQSRAPELIGEAEALATSPVALATLPGRAEPVTRACADQPMLRCVGDAVGRSWTELGGEATWGRVTFGLADPDRGIGLSVLAAAVGDYFSSLDVARNDFEADPGFQSWLEALYPEDPPSSPVRVMVTAQGTYSVAADARARAAADAGQRTIELLEPEQPVTVTAVAVPVNGGDDLPDLAPLREALRTSGWDDASGPAAPTLKPGVMAALHALWTELTR